MPGHLKIDLMRIDAHQHFWIFNAVRDGWITGEMRVIRRNFLPDDLKPLLQQQQINGCIAVQADQSEDETMFLLEQASSNDFIKGVVGWVNLRDTMPMLLSLQVEPCDQ